MKEQNKKTNKENNTPIIIQNIHKTYQQNGTAVPALRGISTEFKLSEITAILGPSGSGKSTLLHILGGIDEPDRKPNTEVKILGKSLLNRSETWLAQFRARNIGFVLQFFGLLPTLTALENVMIAGHFGNQHHLKQRATTLLAQMGLAKVQSHYPSQLSGGQKQRVAIARALINDPRIILADEPTGNLDSENGEQVITILEKLAKEENRCIIVVTHDHQVARRADRVIELRDGQILAEKRRERKQNRSLSIPSKKEV